MKALQRLLTRSFSGKALAVKRVTENQGKRTPGVDGKLWSTPAAKMEAVSTLRQSGYRALPLRRTHIPKKNGKTRPLGIPVMHDRAMQALYKLALDPIAETLADPNSYGFRLGRSTADAIGRCFLVLARKGSAQWVLEGDIQGCFDHINHQWLETYIPIEKRILRQWLKAGFVENDQLYPTEAGTPQGGIISPVLANMTLDGLEKAIAARFPRHWRSNGKTKVYLVRYADDFIITASSRKILEDEVIPLVTEFLAERGLTLSPHKTKITHINDGFDFLGQNIRKYNSKLLIKPAKSNVKTFLDNIRAVIKSSLHLTPRQLLTILNPKIRGWANYHRHVVSKAIFACIDSEIFGMLWRWATRRHPRKKREWIRRRYFSTSGKRQWLFFGWRQTHKGEKQKVHLVLAAKVAIKRHVKVRETANPYDPAWEMYFEQRLERKMNDDLQHRQRLFSLWREQKGICPVCQQKITKETGWHNHHIIWRVHGGSDELVNRVLLHPNCHRQVHSRKLSVG